MLEVIILVIIVAVIYIKHKESNPFKLKAELEKGRPWLYTLATTVVGIAVVVGISMLLAIRFLYRFTTKD